VKGCDAELDRGVDGAHHHLIDRVAHRLGHIVGDDAASLEQEEHLHGELVAGCERGTHRALEVDPIRRMLITCAQ
jgi:hypothetical protein